MSLFPICHGGRWHLDGSSCYGVSEDVARVCSSSGLLQLPGQPLSSHSPHASGLAVDAALPHGNSAIPLGYM